MTFFKEIKWVLIVALIFRASIAFLGWNDILFKSPEKSIAITYERSAYLIANGYGYSQVIPGTESYFQLSGKIDSVNTGSIPNFRVLSRESIYPTQHYPPGYSFVGALGNRLTSLSYRHIMQAFSIAIDLLSLIVFYLLSLKLFEGSKPKSTNSAWVYALYPPIAYSSTALTPDSIMLFFILAISLIFLKIQKNNYWSSVLAIGILNGLGAYFRSDLLLFPAFLSILWLLKTPSFFSISKIIRFNLTVGALSFLILLPWGLRNERVNDNFNITSTSLGGTLVTGLGAFPNPWGVGPSDIDRKREAEQVGIKTPFEKNGDTYFKSKFREYVTDDPLYYTKSLVMRSVYFIAAPYYWGNKKANRTKSFSSIKREGKILESASYIIRVFWGELLSAIISLNSFLVLILLMFIDRRSSFTYFIFLNYLHVFLTHIPIHAATNYVYPIIFCNVLLLVHFFYEKKWEFLVKKLRFG